MLISAYETTHNNEDTYWWYTARREIVLHLRRRYAGAANPLALNIGCGTGGLSYDLENSGRVISLDLEREALRFCRGKNLTRLVQGNGSSLPIQSNSCDEIYALDFLEHLEDDAAGAKEILRCLKPKTGFAVVTVPAFSFLWSRMDDIAHHQRRYRRKDFRRLMVQTGFSIEFLTYINCFLFPLALVFKLAERKSKRNDDEAFLPSLPAWLNVLFKKIFTAEKYFLPWVSFPVGVSLLVVLRKDA